MFSREKLLPMLVLDQLVAYLTGAIWREYHHGLDSISRRIRVVKVYTCVLRDNPFILPLDYFLLPCPTHLTSPYPTLTYPTLSYLTLPCATVLSPCLLFLIHWSYRVRQFRGCSTRVVLETCKLNLASETHTFHKMLYSCHTNLFMNL